jgi:hypothetical protein
LSCGTVRSYLGYLFLHRPRGWRLDPEVARDSHRCASTARRQVRRPMRPVVGVPRNGSPKPPKGARPSPNAAHAHTLRHSAAAIPTHASWTRGRSLFWHRLCQPPPLHKDGSRVKAEAALARRQWTAAVAQLRTTAQGLRALKPVGPYGAVRDSQADNSVQFCVLWRWLSRHTCAGREAHGHIYSSSRKG